MIDFTKHQTAADILPLVPKGKELKQVGLTKADVKRSQQNLHAFVMTYQPRYERESIKAYKDMLEREEQFRRDGE